MHTFYVSPQGSDEQAGTYEKPLGTLFCAVQKANQAGGNARIYLSAGSYFEPQTAVVSAPGISIQALEQPVIVHGGMSVTGWRKAEDASIPGLFVLDLPDLAAASRTVYINGRRATRVQSQKKYCAGWDLFRDPQMMFSNLIKTVKGAQGPKDVYAGYIAANEDMLNWRNPSDIEFVYDVGWTHCIVPVDSITREQDGVFVKMRMPCFETCQIKGGVQVGSPNYIENAYELLGTPGQWYIDKAEKKLYYVPLEGEDLEGAEVIIPVCEQFVHVAGSLEKPVEDVSISGICFAYACWNLPSTEGYAELQANLIGKGGDFDKNLHSNARKTQSALQVEWARGVKVQGCAFTKLGACGIDVGEGAQDIVISDCRLEDVSGSGIQLGGFCETDAQPADERSITGRVRIQNNVLKDIGVEYKGGVGVIAGYVQDVDILHNDISGCAYSGISLGWGWGIFEPDRDSTQCGMYPPEYNMYHRPTVCMRNRICFNHIHHVLEVLHDGGGIYTLGLQNGSIIRGNYVHQTGSFDGTTVAENQVRQRYPHKGSEKSSIIFNDGSEQLYTFEQFTATGVQARRGFPGGIYLDEASGGFYVHENAVWGTALPFFMHDTGTKYRSFSNYVYENAFNQLPETSEAARAIAQRAGVEKTHEQHVAAIPALKL